jgi:hypothetical protein
MSLMKFFLELLVWCFCRLIGRRGCVESLPVSPYTVVTCKYYVGLWLPRSLLPLALRLCLRLALNHHLQLILVSSFNTRVSETLSYLSLPDPYQQILLGDIRARSIYAWVLALRIMAALACLPEYMSWTKS